MKKIEGNLNGSFTVEAALVVPIVIAVMIAAVKIGIDLHVELKTVVQEMEQKEDFKIIETMYFMKDMTDIIDIGELINGN